MFFRDSVCNGLFLLCKRVLGLNLLLSPVCPSLLAGKNSYVPIDVVQPPLLLNWMERPSTRPILADTLRLLGVFLRLGNVLNSFSYWEDSTPGDYGQNPARTMYGRHRPGLARVLGLSPQGEAVENSDNSDQSETDSIGPNTDYEASDVDWDSDAQHTLSENENGEDCDPETI